MVFHRSVPCGRLFLTLVLSLPLLGEKDFEAEFTTDQHISVQSIHRKFPNPEANIRFLCLNRIGEECMALGKILQFR